MKKSFLFSLLLVSLLFVSVSHSADVTFAWDASVSENVAGYKIYLNDNEPVDVGNVLTWKTELPDDVVHRANATAYDAAGYESSKSNTVEFKTPLAPRNFKIRVIVEIEQQ